MVDILRVAAAVISLIFSSHGVQYQISLNRMKSAMKLFE